MRQGSGDLFQNIAWQIRQFSQDTNLGDHRLLIGFESMHWLHLHTTEWTIAPNWRVLTHFSYWPAQITWAHGIRYSELFTVHSPFCFYKSTWPRCSLNMKSLLISSTGILVYRIVGENIWNMANRNSTSVSTAPSKKCWKSACESLNL